MIMALNIYSIIIVTIIILITLKSKDMSTEQVIASLFIFLPVLISLVIGGWGL